MDHNAIISVLAYLGAAVIAVPLFRRIGLGAILGYLVAGAVIGPQGIHFIEHPEQALHFAEFGVVMLLFIIGLELNPEKLWRMRTQIAMLGGGQLFLCAAVIALFCLLFIPLDGRISILLGLTLGLSSTAFAVQLMDEQGIMGQALGRKGFAILLLQDLAVIPVLLLVGFWAPSAVSESSIAWWYGPLAIIIVLVFGRYALNPILKLIAEYGSREVLTAAALLIVLGTAVLMQSSGLSMGMGAFLAGIILANSNYRHQLEADIEPFKGLLLGLFFIAVGMSLDITLFLSSPFLIVGLAVLLMLLKASIITVLVRLRGVNFRDGFSLGLMLSQGGEFAFVVMAKAVSLNLVGESLSNYTVLVVGVSMALTSPFLMLFKRLTKENKEQQDDYDKAPDSSEEPEVVIAGFGRFGQIVGRILVANEQHFTALDKDATHVEFLKRFGNQIFFGDATRSDLLEAAGIAHARVLVVAVDDMEASMRIITLAQEMCPNIRIVARARNRMHMYRLINVGVTNVVRETFESGLLAAHDTLISLGYTESQALGKVDVFRKHDEEYVQKAAEHKDDLPKLMSIAEQGRRELAQLFEQDRH